MLTKLFVIAALLSMTFINATGEEEKKEVKYQTPESRYNKLVAILDKEKELSKELKDLKAQKKKINKEIEKLQKEFDKEEKLEKEEQAKFEKEEDRKKKEDFLKAKKTHTDAKNEAKKEKDAKTADLGKIDIDAKTNEINTNDLKLATLQEDLQADPTLGDVFSDLIEKGGSFFSMPECEWDSSFKRFKAWSDKLKIMISEPGTNAKYWEKLKALDTEQETTMKEKQDWQKALAPVHTDRVKADDEGLKVLKDQQTYITEKILTPWTKAFNEAKKDAANGFDDEDDENDYDFDKDHPLLKQEFDVALKQYFHDAAKATGDQALTAVAFLQVYLDNDKTADDLGYDTKVKLEAAKKTLDGVVDSIKEVQATTKKDLQDSEKEYKTAEQKLNGGGLTWLWITLGVLVAAGTSFAIYKCYCKKDEEDKTTD